MGCGQKVCLFYGQLFGIGNGWRDIKNVLIKGGQVRCQVVNIYKIKQCRVLCYGKLSIGQVNEVGCCYWDIDGIVGSVIQVVYIKKYRYYECIDQAVVFVIFYDDFISVCFGYGIGDGIVVAGCYCLDCVYCVVFDFINGNGVGSGRVKFWQIVLQDKVVFQFFGGVDKGFGNGNVFEVYY